MNKIDKLQRYVWITLIIMIANLFFSIIFNLITNIETRIFSTFSWFLLLLIMIATIGSMIISSIELAYHRGRLDGARAFVKHIEKKVEAEKNVKTKKAKSRRKK